MYFQSNTAKRERGNLKRTIGLSMALLTTFVHCHDRPSQTPITLQEGPPDVVAIPLRQHALDERRPSVHKQDIPTVEVPGCIEVTIKKPTKLHDKRWRKRLAYRVCIKNIGQSPLHLPDLHWAYRIYIGNILEERGERPFTFPEAIDLAPRQSQHVDLVLEEEDVKGSLTPRTYYRFFLILLIKDPQGKLIAVSQTPYTSWDFGE